MRFLFLSACFMLFMTTAYVINDAGGYDACTDTYSSDVCTYALYR